MNLLPAAGVRQAGDMTTTQFSSQPLTTSGTRQARSGAAAALRPLILDLGVPLGSYYLMRAAGVALVPALAVSSIIPAVRTVAGLVKDRSVNGLAALIVVVNVVSIAVTFWTGDPRLMLAKDAAPVPLGEHGPQLSVLGDRQDRVAQPDRGRPGGPEPRLAVEPRGRRGGTLTGYTASGTRHQGDT